MLNPIPPSIPSKFLLKPTEIITLNKINPAAHTETVKVCLVNLVARDYAGKPQPPVAIHTLMAYLSATTHANVKIVDLQQYLLELENDLLQEGREYISIDERFSIATRKAIDEINLFSPHILGPSMKWGTLKPAKQIVSACNKPLVVVGNTIPTFGSDELLPLDPFKGALAVLGEGEEALRNIIEIASKNLTTYTNHNLYRGIPNVKTYPKEIIRRENINLDAYPALTNEEFFGEKTLWATLEASRGCAWGTCSFCSVGGLYASPEWRPLPDKLVFDRIERFVRAGHRWIYFADSDALGLSARNNDYDFEQRIERMLTIARGVDALNKHYATYGYIGEQNKIHLSRLSVRADSVYKKGQPKRNAKKEKLYIELKEKAGLEEVYIGFESGCQEQLNRYGKGILVEEIIAAINILSALGIRIQPGSIFFEPEQTLPQACKAIDFIFGAKCGFSKNNVYRSLRAQAGSKMVNKLAKKYFLAGIFDLDHVSHEISWKFEIGALKEFFELFSTLTEELINHLAYTEDIWLYNLEGEIHQINGRFLKDLLNTPLIPALRKNILANYLQELREKLLLPLEKMLTSGALLAPALKHEVLPRTLKACGELIANNERDS